MYMYMYMNLSQSPKNTRLENVGKEQAFSTLTKQQVYTFQSKDTDDINNSLAEIITARKNCFFGCC